MDLTNEWSLIGLWLVFFVVAMVLAAAEMAIARVPSVRVETLAEDGDTKAKRLAGMLDDLPQVINAILLAVLLAQIGAATVVGVLSERWFSSIGVVIASVVLTFVLFVYTEAIPKTYAFRHPTRVALALSYPVRILAVALGPVVRALVWFADLHVPGKGLSMAPTITERELLSLAADAEEEGEITQIDRLLIERAFRLGDRTAEEIMVPRTDIVGIRASEPLAEAVQLATEAGHRRLLVYGEDLDEIIGIAYLRDLVRVSGTPRPESVGELTQPALVVSEWKRVVDLLRDMQSAGTHLAVVIDEFGGTSGIVTIEDIAEELLGVVADEGELPTPLARTIGDGHWLVAGSMRVDELTDLVGVDLPEGEWNTVAGMILGVAGEVPAVGDDVTIGNLRFRVRSIEGRRITWVDVVTVDETRR
jgi:CBS domain containing-hemolysin-like protein